jgi:hypothetical protein
MTPTKLKASAYLALVILSVAAVFTLDELKHSPVAQQALQTNIAVAEQ